MKYLVRTVGLMRCCLKTLEDRMPLCADEPKEGEKLPCDYCTSRMVFHDGAWEWDRPAMPWDKP